MRVIRRRLREFHVGTLKRRDSNELGLVVFAGTDQFGATRGNYVRLYRQPRTRSASSTEIPYGL